MWRLGVGWLVGVFMACVVVIALALPAPVAFITGSFGGLLGITVGIMWYEDDRGY